ncbi:MAG: PHP domain-containing protein [Thermoanaerobaculia bacterium]
MAGFADLHLHTTHSDGIRSVEELVRLAATLGLSTIAISDHDNIAAFAEAEPIARSLGLLLIPAVELSITWNGADVHLLAYSFDPDDAPLRAKLERCRRTRSSRGEMMVERLRDLGIPIEIARVREVCGEGALGRPHIARCLVEIGATSSIEEAFDRYLSEGKPAWVEKERIELAEAIALVHAAGGLTSLAHPTLYADPERLLQTIIPLGLDGIEVHHPDVDPASRDRYLAIVHEKGLIATGGSDDHGFEGADTIGTVMVPVETIRPISDRWEHRNR